MLHWSISRLKYVSSTDCDFSHLRSQWIKWCSINEKWIKAEIHFLTLFMVRAFIHNLTNFLQTPCHNSILYRLTECIEYFYRYRLEKYNIKYVLRNTILISKHDCLISIIKISFGHGNAMIISYHKSSWSVSNWQYSNP